MNERNPDPIPVDLSRLYEIVDRQAEVAAKAYGCLIPEAIPIQRAEGLVILPDPAAHKLQLLSDLFIAAVKRKVDDATHRHQKDAKTEADK